MKPILLIILITLTNIGFGQKFGKKQSDCAGAVVFYDSITGAINIPKGHGFESIGVILARCPRVQHETPPTPYQMEAVACPSKCFLRSVG